MTTWTSEAHKCENQSALISKETYTFDDGHVVDGDPWKLWTHGYDVNIVFCPFCGEKLK